MFCFIIVHCIEKSASAPQLSVFLTPYSVVAIDYVSEFCVPSVAVCFCSVELAVGDSYWTSSVAYPTPTHPGNSSPSPAICTHTFIVSGNTVSFSATSICECVGGRERDMKY